MQGEVPRCPWLARPDSRALPEDHAVKLRGDDLDVDRRIGYARENTWNVP
jgi:hypothetical protein